MLFRAYHAVNLRKRILRLTAAHLLLAHGSWVVQASKLRRRHLEQAQGQASTDLGWPQGVTAVVVEKPPKIMYIADRRHITPVFEIQVVLPWHANLDSHNEHSNNSSPSNRQQLVSARLTARHCFVLFSTTSQASRGIVASLPSTAPRADARSGRPGQRPASVGVGVPGRGGRPAVMPAPTARLAPPLCPPEGDTRPPHHARPEQERAQHHGGPDDGHGAGRPPLGPHAVR